MYDDWYPGGGEAEVVAFLQARLPAGASVLELGPGTGRLAIPLAAAGLRVTGMDSSPEMLQVIRAKPGAEALELHRGDAGRDEDWPEGPFDAVLAPCNLLLNLHRDGAQQSCIHAAARRLAEDGILVVELDAVAVDPAAPRGLEVRSVEGGTVVLIATEVDPTSGAVRGAHVELRDLEPVRVRPWTLRPLGPDGLDDLCGHAGLELRERHRSWATGEPGSVNQQEPQSAGTNVSVYGLRP